MYLYLKQKVFSLKDKASVKDADGADKYYIEGKALSFGKKLRIYDTNGEEAAFVRQKTAAFMPTFIVETGGEEVARIVRKFGLRPKYVVDGPGWEVRGNFSAHDYIVADGERTVASIHKKWMTWGDTFELTINNDRDEILALAVVLAIDAALDSQAAVAAAST